MQQTESKCNYNEDEWAKPIWKLGSFLKEGSIFCGSVFLQHTDVGKHWVINFFQSGQNEYEKWELSSCLLRNKYRKCTPKDCEESREQNLSKF